MEDDEGRPKSIRLDLDSHADTGIFGRGAVFYNTTGIRVNVDAFKEDLGVLDVAMGDDAVGWDHPETGWPFILNYPQSLRIDGMPSHLANPMQMRCHGVIVNECPLVMLSEDQQTPEAHSMIAPYGDDKLLHIPMTLKGDMSGITVRKPTREEMLDTEGKICAHVQMTSDTE